MSFNIAAADDDPAKALAAAHLLWDSSPHFLSYLYAGHEARGFQDLQYHWLQTAGLLSHRHALAAISDSGQEIFGLAAAMGGDQIEGQADVTAQHMTILGTEREIPDFHERLEILSQAHTTVPPRALYLQNISVRGPLRDSGVGNRLFQAVLNRARAEDYTALHLDVVSDNPAVAFYRRQGMEVFSEGHLPSPGAGNAQSSRYRMVMDVANSP
ncbi:MAG: GNAT family N-acetyltransferase [Rhodospirillaceae bacterium]|nr:GNAT family N-acetyltransferase [Rhodospirillaceae bacterium]